MTETAKQPMPWLRSTTLLILLSLISVFGYAAGLPLFDLDEGAFSSATREMLASGNWVSTYLNGVPRYDKPILTYWLQALSVSAFGLHPFSLRLPSCLAALAWIWLSYRFVKEQRNDQEARLLVWLLICLPLASLIFKAAIADALLNLWLCAACFDSYRYYQQLRLPAATNIWARRWLLARISLWLGLGFLTKGPIAGVIPLLSSLVLFTLSGHGRDWWRAVWHPISLGVFSLIILPWHIAVYQDQGWAFFEGFYLQHNVSRFSSTMESHGGNPLYYLLWLPILLLPFTGVLWRTLTAVRQHWPEPLTIFLLSWFTVVLVLFSLSKTQLPHYLLYGLTPLLILMASQLPRIGRWSLLGPTLALCVFGLLPLTFAPAAAHLSKPFDQAVLALAATEYTGIFIGLSVLAVGTALALWLWRSQTYLDRLLIGAGASMLTFNFLLLPLIGAAQQEPVRQAALLARTLGGPVVSYGINMPSFSVYRDAIVPRRAPRRGELVFTQVGQEAALAALPAHIQPTLLFSRGGIALYRYD